MKEKLHTRWVLNAANFVTFLNMLFGAISILSSAHAHYNWAVAFIGFATLADRYDGKIARHYQTTSALGVQLDSMGDLISFGLAPGLLIYLANFHNSNSWTYVILGAFSTIVYICSGAFRLARYNIEGLSGGGTFAGMPIPLAGGLIALLNLLRHSIPTFIFILLQLFFGFLMVSRVRFKKR